MDETKKSKDNQNKKGHMTDTQHQTVGTIEEKANFDQWCSNPRLAKINGPLDLLWYTKKGILNFARIAKNGKVLKSCSK